MSTRSTDLRGCRRAAVRTPAAASEKRREGQPRSVPPAQRAGRSSGLDVGDGRDRHEMFTACWLAPEPSRDCDGEPERITVIFLSRGYGITFDVDVDQGSGAGGAGRPGSVASPVSAGWQCGGSMRYLQVRFAPRFAADCPPVPVEFCRFADEGILRKLGFVPADIVWQSGRCDPVEASAWASLRGRRLAPRCDAAPAALCVGETAGRHSAVVVDAVRLIDDNLQQKLTVTWLARVTGTSRIKFTRLFKASTGTSPYRFITERRLSKARQLLLSSFLPFGDVANAVGFSSQSHMTSVFQQNVGVTPKEYRSVFGRNR